MHIILETKFRQDWKLFQHSYLSQIEQFLNKEYMQVAHTTRELQCYKAV